MNNKFEFLFFLILILIGCQNNNLPVNNISKSNSMPVVMSGGHIIFKGTIQDTINVNFILDTGAPYTLICDSTFAQRIGLTKIEQGPNNTRYKRVQSAEEENKFQRMLITFAFGKVNGVSKSHAIIDMKRIIGDKAELLIGMEFMKNYIVEINYFNNTISFNKGNISNKNKLIDSIRINPVDKSKLRYEVLATFYTQRGDSFKERCIIDLGASGGTIGFSTRLVKKHNLLYGINLKPEIKREGTTMKGEVMTGHFATLKAIKIGKFKIDTPSVFFHTNKTGMTAAEPSLIGNYILRKFGHIYISFNKNMIYITKP
ncbi:hypothetical protein CA265_12575 [Sphingobacteriaceae bacterium GW460-11-11-14-LB5]|nr:hypothetical protein CA265_12575 [Sphingobacteriaceae bacterium GW460-11-11-14-LB5]